MIAFVRPHESDYAKPARCDRAKKGGRGSATLDAPRIWLWHS
jgi:hypothetical protein